MFFRRKRIPEQELSAEEYFKLMEYLDENILQWVKKEIKNGIEENTQLYEISVFNMKLIYEDSEEARDMRLFMLNSLNGKGEADGTFSRIQDLYLSLNMIFPSYFLEAIRIKHINTLEDLGYSIDMHDTFVFGWILMKIQDTIRYRI